VKYTIRKITREANFLSLTGNFTVAFFGFAGFALLARSYSMDIFGQWVLYVSSATFIEMFRFGITNWAIIRYLSGVDDEDRLKYIGSNALIVILSTVTIAVIIWGSYLLFPGPIRSSGYELFFRWYPILAFINISYNNALVIMQADQRFGRIMMIKTINSIGFFIVLLTNFLFFRMSLTHLVWANLGINVITSGICFSMGWDGMRHIRKATKKTSKVLLDFGKYTIFTLIGTNLLRSADTLIISLSPLGTTAVALYSVPMKLAELQQIPLRSFVATAFPRMSKASIHGKVDEVRRLFYTYSGAMTYLLCAISIFTFCFAHLFVLLLGGKQYLGIDPVTGSNTVTIVRIFSIYGLFLPIDRMAGAGLDSINKPERNFLKVMYMLGANVIGDLIAVFVFHSLEAVAVASILFTLLGIVVGYRFLDKELELDQRRIWSAGIGFYREMYVRLQEYYSKLIRKIRPDGGIS